jgi:hypothetical protein
VIPSALRKADEEPDKDCGARAEQKLPMPP